MEKLNDIVENVIVDYAREEALEILSHASEKRVQEFIRYFNEDKRNICCLHLDLMKKEAVEAGLMTWDQDNDHFGPHWEL